MQEESTAPKPVAVSSAYKTASDRRVVVQGLPCATVIAPRYLTEGHKKQETVKKSPKRLINSGLLLVSRQSDNACKISHLKKMGVIITE